MLNQQVILISRPEGVAQASNFALQDIEVKPLEDGEVLVRNHYLAVEPAMRGWIADKASYAKPVPIGGVMRSMATGEILESRHSSYKPRDLVMGWLGWQTFPTVPASAIDRVISEDEITTALGILGINGLTAYLALTRIGQPKPGNTLLVTSAAGAVGSAVGQIGKLMGCRAVGVTGGSDKVTRCIEEFGFDAAMDYRQRDLKDQVEAACPLGIDIFFDNVSGHIADSILPNLADRARVVVCGTASIPNWNPWPTGLRVERHLLIKRARMEGFVIFDHADEYQQAREQLRAWISDGHLKFREEILNGLEACPDALAGLYRGENQGRRLIRL